MHHPMSRRSGAPNQSPTPQSTRGAGGLLGCAPGARRQAPRARRNGGLGALATLATIVTLALGAACTEGAPTAEDAPSAGLEIAVAPLDLTSVGRAVYTISVATAEGVVWTQEELDSVRFGDGQGALTYVGPCDASTPEHTVTLLLVALYDTDGALIPPSTWRNPTPLSVPAHCEANTDTRVDINLTILRDAQQGFFDIAVNFSDIFCSAKLDCEDDNGDDLHLLHRPGGARDTTLVFALACTGGPDADTHLFLDDIAIACTDATFDATVDVSAGPGNVTPLGNAGGLLYAAAIYRGDEAIGHSAYWNAALGLDTGALATAGTCRLTAHATASDGPLPGNTTPPFTAYPYIVWDLDVVADGARACTRDAVNAAGSGVQTAYTPIAPTGRTFAHAYQRGDTGTTSPPGCLGCALDTVTPAAIPTATETVVTLSGAFAAAGDCAECELQQMPGGQPLAATFDAAAGTITFTAPAGLDDLAVRFIVGLEVVPFEEVAVDAQGRLITVSSPTTPIHRLAPTVTSVTGCATDAHPGTADCPPFAAVVLTLSGADLGDDPDAVTVTVDGTPCADPAPNHTTLTCVLPERPQGGFDLDVVVTVNGRTGTLPGAVSYFGPSVVDGSVACAACTSDPDGTLVLQPDAVLELTITPAVDDESSVAIFYGAGALSYPCAITPGSLSPDFGANTSTLSCAPVALGVGAELAVRVSVGPMTSRPSEPILRYPAPQVVGGTVTPSLGTLNGGEWVALTVEQVGDDPAHIAIHYGPDGDPTRFSCAGVRVLPTDRTDPAHAVRTDLECLTVPGAGTGHRFTVTAAGQASQPSADTFSYPIVPTVTEVSGCPGAMGAATVDCPTTGGLTLSVVGTSFEAHATAWLDGEVCPASTVVSSTLITCTLPPGTGTRSVQVRSGLVHAVPLPAGVRYAPPKVHAVSGCTDLGPTTYACPTAGGAVITLEGADFGPSGAEVTVDGVACADAAHDATTPHHKLTCTLPAGSGVNAEVRVTVGGAVSDPAYLSYAPSP